MRKNKLTFLILAFKILLFQISVAAYPKRIISLGPYITEELFLLGSGNQVVGCTTYCIRPEQAAGLEKIGNAMQVNIEKVISLNPDLVLATALVEKRAIVKLKQLGLRIEVFPVAKSFDQLCEIFIRIGDLTGNGRKAAEIVKNCRVKIAAIRNSRNSLKKPKVFMQVGSKPLFTIVKNSFMHDYIEFAGGQNISNDLKTGIFSREQVVRRNPDIILIVSMGITSGEEKQVWQNFRTINAVKYDRIYFLDSYKACSPTPVTFVEVLEEISNHFD